jgi:hypothetical protein
VITDPYPLFACKHSSATVRMSRYVTRAGAARARSLLTVIMRQLWSVAAVKVSSMWDSSYGVWAWKLKWVEDLEFECLLPKQTCMKGFILQCLLQIIANDWCIKTYSCLYGVLFVGLSGQASFKLLFQVPEGIIGLVLNKGGSRQLALVLGAYGLHVWT